MANEHDEREGVETGIGHAGRGPVVSRRRALAAAGTSVIATAVVTAALTRGRDAPLARTQEPAAPMEPPSADPAMDLLAPLSAGSRLGPWTVERVGPVELGALPVLLRGASGAFALEVVRRDENTLRAPSTTARFAVLVRNRGTGATPTEEDQGLAAMALGQVIAANEHSVPAPSVLSLGERLERYEDTLAPDGVAALHAKRI